MHFILHTRSGGEVSIKIDQLAMDDLISYALDNSISSIERALVTQLSAYLDSVDEYIANQPYWYPLAGTRSGTLYFHNYK